MQCDAQEEYASHACATHTACTSCVVLAAQARASAHAASASQSPNAHASPAAGAQAASNANASPVRIQHDTCATHMELTPPPDDSASAQQQPDEFDQLFGAAKRRKRPGATDDKQAQPAQPELQPGLHSRGGTAATATDAPAIVGDGGASWRRKALMRAQRRAGEHGRSLDEEVSERFQTASELVSLKGTDAAAGTSHLRAVHERRGDDVPQRSTDRKGYEKRSYLLKDDDSKQRMRRSSHQTTDDAFQSRGRHGGSSQDRSYDQADRDAREDNAGAHHPSSGRGRSEHQHSHATQDPKRHTSVDTSAVQAHTDVPGRLQSASSAQAAPSASCRMHEQHSPHRAPSPKLEQRPARPQDSLDQRHELPTAAAPADGNLSAAAMLRARIRGTCAPTHEPGQQRAQALPQVDSQVCHWAFLYINTAQKYTTSWCTSVLICPNRTAWHEQHFAAHHLSITGVCNARLNALRLVLVTDPHEPDHAHAGPRSARHVWPRSCWHAHCARAHRRSEAAAICRR